MLYSHNDINNNSDNTNTDGRNESFPFYLQSLVTRGERERETQTQIIKAYANHTMLTPGPTKNVQCILWCLRSQFISAGRDRNWSDLIRSEKLNHALHRSTSTLRFKILKLSRHPSWTWRHPPTQFAPTTVQPHFLSGGLLWQMMTVISIPRGRKTAKSDNAPELRDTE